jgi:hypothetical protein
MGVADNRDGVSLMQRTREKDLVLPSEITNLRDLEAYLKIANYSIAKVRFDYKKFPDKHEPFIVRDDLLLENIVAEQLLISSKANAVSASNSNGNPESNERQNMHEHSALVDSDRSVEIEEEISNC